MSTASLPARTFRWLETWPPLRRLDATPFMRALVFGVVLGLLVGFGVLSLPAEVKIAVAVIVIALAGAVAWSAQPVGIWEAAEEAEPLLDMVAIEGGSFLMGSPKDELGHQDNETQHRVAVSVFRMGRTTVTKAQYREVMELDQAPGAGGDEHPVSEVSWFDAATFCNRLSEREDLTPCYRIEGEEVAWIEDAGGYRLPTEAEWEYATRAGSTGRWSFGDDEEKLGDYAWFGDNSGFDAHEVGVRKPNPWGLYDMHGNVWEWCWDAYGEYQERASKDPRGPDEPPGARRVLRGGAFDFGPWLLRSAIRARNLPVFSDGLIGFRCVRRARRQP